MAQSVEFILLFLRNLRDNRDIISSHSAAQRPRKVVNLEKFNLKGVSRQRDAPTSEFYFL